MITCFTLSGIVNSSSGISVIMLKKIIYPPRESIPAALSEIASSKAIEKSLVLDATFVGLAKCILFRKRKNAYTKGIK